MSSRASRVLLFIALFALVAILAIHHLGESALYSLVVGLAEALNRLLK